MYTSRKWLALFVLMLLAAVLAACANDEPTPTVDPQPVATEAPVVLSLIHIYHRGLNGRETDYT